MTGHTRSFICVANDVVTQTSRPTGDITAGNDECEGPLTSSVLWAHLLYPSYPIDTYPSGSKSGS